MTIVQVGVLRLGRQSYANGLKFQNYAVNLLKNNKDNSYGGAVILVEHSPAYTIGIRSKDYTAKDEDKARAVGAEFFRTNRGGLITFHGPGQLVAYPVLDLKRFKPSVRWYVDTLEECAIEACRGYGLQGARSPHTGVWVNDRKICAIGVHVSRWVTSHGVALNCNTDLAWFSHIVPCGIVGKGVTSLSAELGRDVTIEHATPQFLNAFAATFNCSLVESTQQQLDRVLAVAS